MIQILLLCFSVLLLLVSWYLKKRLTELELLFTNKNRQNLIFLGNSYLILGVVSACLGIFKANTVITLFFISLVSIVSAIFSVRLAKNMK